MKNPTTKQVSNHLEFLGFEIKEVPTKKPPEVLLATHDSRSNLIVRVLESNFILLTSRYGTGLKKKKVGINFFLEALCSANLDSMFSRWYFDVDDDDDSVTLAVDSFIQGYDKLTFGKIVEGLENEVTNHVGNFEDF